MKRTDLRQYLIQKASNKDYNVVKKNESQDQEMEKIAGAARIVYDIILNCKFGPIQYICILAVLMDKGKYPNFICSSMRTPTGHYIDLFLESGIFTLIKNNITQEAPTKSNQTCSIEEQFSRIVMEDRTIDTTQEVNPPINNIREHSPQPITPIINAAANINPIYPFDQQEIQLGITLQESYNSIPHQSNQQQPQITQEEQSIQIIEDHGFTIQSASESIDPPKDNPATTLPPEIDYSAIFIYGLTHFKLDHELREAFKEFGTIQKIFRPTRKTAVITYRTSTQAAKAIEKMNGTVFMREIISVSLSEPNRKRKAIKKEIEYENQTDNNTITSTSFTIINSDQSIWGKLEQDTKDFDMDIKDFVIEDQRNPASQENAQINHHPYNWNDSINQHIKQEIIEKEQQEKEQQDNEDSSWQTGDSLPSLESKQDINFNSSSTSEIATSINPYSPVQIQIPPISPASSTSFHGFESPTSYSPNYSTKRCLDQRLDEYNSHCWDIVIMEHVDIKPN